MVATVPATKSICCGYEIYIKVTLDIKLYYTQPMDVDILILHAVLYRTSMQLWISVPRLMMVNIYLCINRWRSEKLDGPRAYEKYRPCLAQKLNSNKNINY